MRILIFLLFLLPLSLIGQVESQFNGTLNVFSGTRIGSTNTFTISGIFNSTTTSYTSSQSDTGDIVQVQSGSRFYWLHIYSIASNSGGVITCNVRDSSSTLTTFPLGKWNVFRPTPNLRLPLSPDGESNASRSATFNTLALRVDEIQSSVASATNCEQTFTKASHGFRKGTPVFWNGSTYIRPTADSLVPDFVVVDSLTVNTFKVANCGTYTTSLANGLYWFTSASPGYSLTSDTTKVPLFQVLNGKLILNPIVGFNLMTGTLHTSIDTSNYIKGLGTIGTIPIFSGTKSISNSKMVYNGGTKQIKYTGADFFVEDSIIGGVTLQVKNKAQGANVTTGLVAYNQSDDYAVFGMSSNGYNPGGSIGGNRGYIYTEAGRGFLMYSLKDTSRLMFKVGGGGGREMYLNSVGLGINRIATNSTLEVAGSGEFHGATGVTYIGAYGGSFPTPSAYNTGYIYNTNTRFGIFSGPGFSVNDDIILHTTSTRKVSIRAINDTLPGIGISLSKATFIREKLIIAPDSTFKFDPSTNLLQLSKYGTTATTAATLAKTESGYVASFATDGTMLSRAANTERYNTITSTTSPQTLASTIADNLINQGGTQGTFTFRLPASPVDGQISKATFANTVTVLTIDGNGTAVTGTLPTTVALGTQIIFKNYTGVGWVRQL